MNIETKIIEENSIKQQLVEKYIKDEFDNFIMNENIKDLKEYLFGKQNPLVILGSGKSYRKLSRLIKKFNKQRRNKIYLLNDSIYYVPFVSFNGFLYSFEPEILEIVKLVQLVNEKKMWKYIKL